MVKKSENPRKLQKISNFTFCQKKNLEEKKFCKKKMLSSLTNSFPILGGNDSTRALQSSPFQKYEKSYKNTFFFYFFFKKM